MTLREFLEQVRAMRNGPHHRYSWRLPEPEGTGVIRTTNLNSVGQCHCPITALAEDTDGSVYLSTGFRNAGKMLGLSDATMNHIVDAADCLGQHYENPHHRKLLTTLRKRICEALQGAGA